MTSGVVAEAAVGRGRSRNLVLTTPGVTPPGAGVR